MGEGSSGPGGATPGFPEREATTQPNPVQPAYQPTYIPPRRGESTVPPAPGEPVTHRPTDRAPQPAPSGPPWEGAPGGAAERGSGGAAGGAAPQSASDVLRYGPGVPASQAGAAAVSSELRSPSVKEKNRSSRVTVWGDMVRISDARMSGTSFGTVVLHTAPESAIGGPLAIVQNGDQILLDVEGRRVYRPARGPLRSPRWRARSPRG